MMRKVLCEEGMRMYKRFALSRPIERSSLYDEIGTIDISKLIDNMNMY